MTMQRTLLTTLVATMLLAVAAPAASAQAVPLTGNSTLSLELHGLEAPITAGASAKLLGELRLTTDSLTPTLSPEGLRVELSVIEAPEWATVVLSPSTVVLYPNTAPPVGYASEYVDRFEATVAVDPDTLERGWETITLRAEFVGNAFMAPATAESSAAVRADDALPCHHDETPEDAAAGDDLSVQTGGAATPLAARGGILAVGGIAIVGAIGVATLLRRRFL